MSEINSIPLKMPEMMKNQDYSQIALAAKQKIKEKDYWLNKLSGELEKTCFPTDYPTNEHERKTGTVTFSLPPGCYSSLMSVTSGSDLKIQVILAAALVVLLHKYTGNNDITIGSPIYKQEIKGDFINTIMVLRNQIQQDMTFKELLVQMRQTILAAIENLDYPVQILAKQLHKTYSPNDDFPLFDVTISVENIQDKKYLRSLRTNMGFSFIRTNENIEGILEYNAGKYRETTTWRITDHFTRLLQEVTGNLELKLSQIDILSRQEKTQLLFEFNDEKTMYPRNKTIHQLFEEQVKKAPDHIAVVGTCQLNQRENNSLTYRELNGKANQLAGALRYKGLEPEQAVGIMTESSVEMTWGLLAILKAGGAYLPINPQYPGKRKKYLLRESRAKILAATRVLLEEDGMVRMWEGETIFLEEQVKPGGEEKHNLPPPQTQPPPGHRLAYIIYTSGSTGKPKGVLVEHHSVVRLVKHTSYIEFQKKHRILQTGALEFDASTFEIWGALLNGHELHLAPKESILTPEKLKEILHNHHITTIWMTAPLFNQMVDTDIEIFQPLRNLLVGGDVLSPPHIDQIKKRYPGLNVINGYGPTENTTFSTTFSIEKEYKGNIPIGKPITNSTAYIIDRYGYLVPIGVEGELVVGGEGVARGYLNNPELTIERFCLRRPGGRFLKKLPPGPPAKTFYPRERGGLPPCI